MVIERGKPFMLLLSFSGKFIRVIKQTDKHFAIAVANIDLVRNDRKCVLYIVLVVYLGLIQAKVSVRTIL